MDSEIQFSHVKKQALKVGARPDQDAQFIVAKVGDGAEDALPIFVDLDVMRDMVAHAFSNTKVELGGVMLGQAMKDSDGRPFIVIHDCLRANHYEATRGTFKFTHDTWTEIARQRDGRRQDLQIVGWYHTHPGFTVFLSQMDTFICESFFSSPEDVALVIDPCNETAGWFQWRTCVGQEKAEMQPSGGYRLFAHHLRRDELHYFAKLYRQDPEMNDDPRYLKASNPQRLAPTIMVGGQRGWFDVGIVFLLILPVVLLCVAGVLGWGALRQDLTVTNGSKVRVAQTLAAENSAYREMLQTMVAAEGGADQLVKNYADLKLENRLLHSNVEGQIARVDMLTAQQDIALSHVSTLEVSQQNDSQTIENLSSEVLRLRNYNDQMLASSNSTDVGGIGYTWAAAIGVLAALGGAVFGKLFAGPEGRVSRELKSSSKGDTDEAVKALA